MHDISNIEFLEIDVRAIYTIVDCHDVDGDFVDPFIYGILSKRIPTHQLIFESNVL